MTDIIIGTPRRDILRDFGLSESLLDVLQHPERDPLSAAAFASNGEVLAEIAGLVGVDGALPEGRVVPVCHIDESMLWYVLLVEEDDQWLLVSWTAEATEPIDGGLVGWLTDIMISSWELATYDDETLVAFGERLGHPAAARLVTALRDAEGQRGGWEESKRWRRAFLDGLGQDPEE